MAQVYLRSVPGSLQRRWAAAVAQKSTASSNDKRIDLTLIGLCDVSVLELWLDRSSVTQEPLALVRGEGMQ